MGVYGPEHHLSRYAEYGRMIEANLLAEQLIVFRL